MNEPKTLIAFLALIVSVVSLLFAWLSYARTRRAENIKELLGEKETIAFAAFKLLKKKRLPFFNRPYRNLLLAAVMQACYMEPSDRARAVLYRFLYENREKYNKEITKAFNSIQETFDLMVGFQFPQEELDLKRVKPRVEALKKVLQTQPILPNPSLISESAKIA